MKMCVNGLNDVNRYSMQNAIRFRICGKLKKARKNSIQNHPNSRKAVLQKLKTPPKSKAHSFDNVAKIWQNSEHMKREMRNGWYVYLKVRVQNVIAAEVKKQSYNHEKWIGGQI